MKLATAFIMCSGLLSSCNQGLESIDRNAQKMIDEHNAKIGVDVGSGQFDEPSEDSIFDNPVMDGKVVTDRSPGTVNPGRDRLRFEKDDSGRSLSELLDFYTNVPADAPRYGLQESMEIAVANSRDYLTAKEELLLAALRLMNQRHLFSPRFFNDVSANLNALGESGDEDIALQLSNEFRVTQQLQSGGNLTARAIVNATEQLRETVVNGDGQSANLILSADIPLLRGAGTVAAEPLISAEREMVYATRTFERFRRQFLFDIATNYFDLVLAAGRIRNAEQVLKSRQGLYNETQALLKAGRKAKFDVSEAEQRVLQSKNSLASAKDAFVVALERFRSRIGIPPDSPFMIKKTVALDIPVPKLDMEESVRQGLMLRLDLQNTRDQVDDARRSVRNARNNLLPDLNLTASVEAMTDPSLRRAGLQFDLEKTNFRTGITYGLPLDRETERIGLRQSIVSMERANRRLQDDEDNVALAVRRAIRDIQLARFSLDLQEESIRIIEDRIRGLKLRTRNVNPRSLIDAADDLQSALEGRDSALRDLRVAILRYLLETGQFRVSTKGAILLPPDLEKIAKNDAKKGVVDEMNDNPLREK